MSTTRENTPHPIGHVRQIASDMPTAAEVEALDRSAGKVIASMHALLVEVREARTAVLESRYKGSAWNEAEAADLRAVMNGEQPTALSTLIAGEPQRYALALALTTALEARLDGTRHSGSLEKAATAARAQMTALLTEAAQLIEQAWPKRDTARGLVALEDAEKLVQQAQRLMAVVRWLDGTDRRMDSNAVHYVPLHPAALGRLTAHTFDQRQSVPMVWDAATMGIRPDDWIPAAAARVGMTVRSA